MDTLIDHAGVPRITPKGLRHTAQVGRPGLRRRRQGDAGTLCYADIGITLGMYSHTVTEQHRQAGDRLDEVFTTQPRRRS